MFALKDQNCKDIGNVEALNIVNKLEMLGLDKSINKDVDNGNYYDVNLNIGQKILKAMLKNGIIKLDKQMAYKILSNADDGNTDNESLGDIPSSALMAIAQSDDPNVMQDMINAFRIDLFPVIREIGGQLYRNFLIKTISKMSRDDVDIQGLYSSLKEASDDQAYCRGLYRKQLKKKEIKK